MRIMVLGANGYLGKKIIYYLSDQHYVTGVYRNIPATKGKIKMITADIGDIHQTFLEEKYDWVINCAAVYEHVDTKIHDVVDANMIFALRVLDCATENGIKKFLTIDTGLPKELNLYSFTKKQFAEFGRFYAEKYGITFINVLMEMFYGEDEPKSRFLLSCISKMIHGEEINLTAGTQKRDLIYIDDVCRAILLLLDSDLMGFWNVPLGCGEGIAVRLAIEYLYKLTGSTSVLNFGSIPLREGEPDCIADISLLKKMGFVPHYTWKEGLRRFCEKYRELKIVSDVGTEKIFRGGVFRYRQINTMGYHRERWCA